MEDNEETFGSLPSYASNSNRYSTRRKSLFDNAGGVSAAVARSSIRKRKSSFLLKNEQGDKLKKSLEAKKHWAILRENVVCSF